MNQKHPAEVLLKEIYIDVKQAGKNGDSGYYLKPISAAKAQTLLQYVAHLNGQLDAYKKSLDVHMPSTIKLQKAVEEIEKLCTLKFPESGAKADLIQERLVKLWSDLKA